MVDWVGDYVLDAVHRRAQERMAGLPLFAATIATITNHMQPPPGLDLTPRRRIAGRGLSRVGEGKLYFGYDIFARGGRCYCITRSSNVICNSHSNFNFPVT